MHIGIYGGAFDPPHLAHAELAEVAIRQFGLDQLLIIPTGDAVHKRRALTASHHRLAMTRLAFAELPQAVVDPREINRGGASYTIDTLAELKAKHPGAQFTLIIGQDQLTAFHTWKDYRAVLSQAKLAVALAEGMLESPVLIGVQGYRMRLSTRSVKPWSTPSSRSKSCKCKRMAKSSRRF